MFLYFWHSSNCFICGSNHLGFSLLISSDFHMWHFAESPASSGQSDNHLLVWLTKCWDPGDKSAMCRSKIFSSLTHQTQRNVSTKRTKQQFLNLLKSFQHKCFKALHSQSKSKNLFSPHQPEVFLAGTHQPDDGSFLQQQSTLSKYFAETNNRSANLFLFWQKREDCLCQNIGRVSGWLYLLPSR